MRIRTIKPEFWSHERLSSLSFPARLLAIALLNYADDEGLFNANPKLIGATLFPYDSLKIHGLITELSRIGYLEFRKCSDPCAVIGRIVKFKEHQVINRPKPSRLKAYFDSGIDHGLISDSSLLEWKGKEGNGHTPNPSRGPRRFAPVCEPTPDFLIFWDEYPRHEKMKDAWAAWQKMKPELNTALETLRKAKRTPAWNRGQQYIPLAGGWIRDERWDDEI